MLSRGPPENPGPGQSDLFLGKRSGGAESEIVWSEKALMILDCERVGLSLPSMKRLTVSFDGSANRL